jgi:PPOX class probable F420-dependent enzyme
VSGPPRSPYGDRVNRRRQVQMTPDEAMQVMVDARELTMCTFNHDGTIHAVAMWYGFLDGALAVHTKSKSQKITNLRRDPRITCLVAEGTRYEELRGVEVVGTAELVEDPGRLWTIGVSVFERHVAPYDATVHKAAVGTMLHNRIGVVVRPERTVTWDHRKLG